MPITFASKGSKNRIVRITGRDEVRSRLESMGLTVGEHVTVISELGGNLIVKVKDTRVALDKTLAQRIII